MVIATAPAAFLFATTLASQVSHALFDDTFAGIYHLQFFDWALLIPYFAILVILSFYGCHRFEMIRKFYQHRDAHSPEPAARFAELPRVTIQLPLYNERYVVERLLEEVSKTEYPRELLQIQVLDDSTDETHPFTEALVREYQAAGVQNGVFCRNRELAKHTSATVHDVDGERLPGFRQSTICSRVRAASMLAKRVFSYFS